jgi:DNA (cytosine-5)-methyltransferase 1
VTDRTPFANKYSFVDVFSGAGGLSIGFTSSGLFEPVAAVEMNSCASKTYQQNIRVPVYVENLAITQPIKLIDSAQKKGFKTVDVIIGGPPCKPFTTANRGGTKWEKVKEKLEKEKKVVENLEWFSYWKIIKGIQPKAFVAENVTGLRLRKEVLETFLTRVKDTGYTTNFFEVDAQFFGVPQRRKRIFIVGVKKPNLDPKELIINNPKIQRKDFVTVEKAISDLPRLNNDDTTLKVMKYLHRKPTSYQTLMRGDEKLVFDHRVHSVHSAVANRFKYIPQGYNLRKAWIEGKIPDSIMRKEYFLGKAIRKFSDKTLKNMHSNIYRRLEWNNISCTITNARKTVLIHPLQDRLISIREAARLQSFPDCTQFYGGLDQQYQQIADAVPPLLSRSIAIHLAGVLLEKEVELLQAL